MKGLTFKISEFEVGYDYWNRTGCTVEMFGRRFGGIEEDALQEIKKADSAIYVAVHASRFPQKELDHPIPLIRRYLGLYANVVSAESYKGISRTPGMDLLRVRELTEGMYHPPEFALLGKYVCSLAVVSEQTSRRVARFSFNLAKTRDKKKVTVVEKKGSIPEFFSLFLNAVKGESEKYPEIQLDTINMVNLPHDLITQPSKFDVILTPNLYGSIIAGEMAALMGGLGLLPSGSYGEEVAIFRPQHGSAPDIAGRGIANPIATINASRMMLDYLAAKTGNSRCKEAAVRIKRAVKKTLEEQRLYTPDLGGNATTRDVIESILRNIG